MAKTSKTCYESFKNSQARLLFLALLLIVSLYALSLNFSLNFEKYEASSGSKGQRALLEKTPASQQYSSMKLHQDQRAKTVTTSTTAAAAAAAAATRKDKQFGMAAHAVPSGPNPESNR